MHKKASVNRKMVQASDVNNLFRKAKLQQNSNGSNTFGIMKIVFETGVVRANEC